MYCGEYIQCCVFDRINTNIYYCECYIEDEQQKTYKLLDLTTDENICYGTFKLITKGENL